MYGLESLMRYRDKLDDAIKSYQQPLATPRDLVEWRVLNENEEVDNLYVSTKTLFVSENKMVLKGIDGSLEKWEIKKVYPIDKKDEKINQLEEEIRKLKEEMYEHSEPNEPIGERNKSIGTNDVNVEPKSETNGKSISE